MEVPIRTVIIICRAGCGHLGTPLSIFSLTCNLSAVRKKRLHLGLLFPIKKKFLCFCFYVIMVGSVSNLFIANHQTPLFSFILVFLSSQQNKTQMSKVGMLY